MHQKTTNQTPKHGLCFRSVFSNITELLLLQIPAAIFALGNLCMEKILPETLVISGSN